MNKKSVLYIISIFIVVIGAFILFNINSSKTSDTTSNSNQHADQIQITPGPTGKTCSKTIDCTGECGDDSCYVASCTKKNNSSSGSCVCLQICEE